jgi:hypothetical protein
MLRLRFIKPGQPKRFLLRCPFTEDTFKISQLIIDNGYKPVGLVKYWLHVLFWNKKKSK